MQPDHPLPPDADRVVISVNPKSGGSSPQERVDRLAGLLAGEGLQTEVLTDLDEVACRANQWHVEGRLRALVGVGGDGTAAELVNRTLPGEPLAMLPAGNENLLARHFGIGRSAEACCRMVRDGMVRRLDAGRANGRVFLLMVGCGFDAEVVHRLHQHRQGHVCNWSYVKPIFQSIRGYQYPELRVYWSEDGASASQAEVCDCVRWLFAFNLPCYGAGLKIAPQACGTDGLLDVCTFRRGGLWHGLRYVGAVLRGRHQRLADCGVRRAERLRVTAEAQVPYQLDGDPGGFLPLDIEVLPGRLTLVVPGDGGK